MHAAHALPMLLLAASLTAQAPAPPQAIRARKAVRAREAAPEAIVQEVNLRFCRAMEAGDAAAVAAVYTEDAELHMSKEEVHKGREGIKAFAEGFLKATPVRSATVTSTAAHRSGNTITDTGIWSFQVDDHGKITTMGGTYIQLLWRGKDGQWRLHRDYPFTAAPAK